MDLFESPISDDGALVESQRHVSRPLADRMRPSDLEQFCGQRELVGKNTILRRMIEKDEVRSLILWGPPGTGKTTLARLIASNTDAHFLSLSAVSAGIRDIKEVIEKARLWGRSARGRAILFVDEIHRFNRTQQDALLPHVESGLLTLLGATTENPSFSVIAPLLSRCQVFSLESLGEVELEQILRGALRNKDCGLGDLQLSFDDAVIGLLAKLADGDARRALNLLEMSVCSLPLQSDGSYVLDIDAVQEIAQRKQYLYDATGEQHYNLISAFHKSLRGSDVQASVYWCVRMLSAGEDPLYILRRMLVFAAEDVGNSDPQALQVTVAAKAAFEALGQPEGEIPLMQAVVYLATCPKSNASYLALRKAQKRIDDTGSLAVPKSLRNAVTGLMKDMGYGKGYAYDHDAENHFAPQNYLPNEVADDVYYQPGSFGFEREIAKRIAWWDAQRATGAGVAKATGSDSQQAIKGKDVVAWRRRRKQMAKGRCRKRLK